MAFSFKSKAEFIDFVNEDISVGCGINVKLKAKQYDNIIRQAVNWFHENWYEAVSPDYIIISARKFYSKEFRDCRYVQFPDCYVSVDIVQESENTFFTGSPDKDFSANKFLLAEAYLAPFESDALLYRTVQFSYYDLAKQFVLQDLQFDYSPAEFRLYILGREPRKDVIVRAYRKIDEIHLYNLEKFQRYVIARAKIQAGRTASYLEYPLIGGVTYNASMLLDEGKEEFEQVRNEIREEETSGSFFMWA